VFIPVKWLASAGGKAPNCRGMNLLFSSEFPDYFDAIPYTVYKRFTGTSLSVRCEDHKIMQLNCLFFKMVLLSEGSCEYIK